MNSSQINVLIEEFIEIMKTRFPSLEVIKQYDETDNDHMIFHNYKNWQDDNFRMLKISLIESIFESKDIYNVCFSYSSDVKSPNLCDSYDFNFIESDDGVWFGNNLQIAA